jgi:hypothetical protein
MAAGAAGLFSPTAPHRSKEPPGDGSSMIATALEGVPLLLIDISAVPGEPKPYFDLRHRPNRNVQIPREFPPTTFRATFRDVRGH